MLNYPTSLRRAIRTLSCRIHRWTRPSARPVIGYVLDHFRSRGELLRENAILRKQLEVACRQIKPPKLSRADRAILVWLARIVSTWRHAVLLVQPETIQRWHRQGFRLLWLRRSRSTGAQPRIAADTIALIK